MKTEITKKQKKIGIAGLFVMTTVTTVYLVMLYIAKEQINSPIFEILMGLGAFVLVMLGKFFFEYRKK